MISVEYVLADTAFEPKRSVDRAAGLDIKAYLLDGRTPVKPFESIKTDYAILQTRNSYREDIKIYLDGKAIGIINCKGEVNIADESNYLGKEYLFILPEKQVVVNAGFKVGLSTDDPNKIAAMLVCPRSGLAAKYGITVTNAPGIVDEHYPDWVGVVLINHGKDLHLFSHGAKIAQVMYIETCLEQSTVVDQLTTIGERTGGFGSSGI